MPDTALKAGAPPAAHFAYPLSECHAHAKLPLPNIELVPAEAVPEPFRTLLAHNDGVTPLLESAHHSRLHLILLNRDRRGSFYYREAVLRLDHDERPVAFCANKIFMMMFSEEAQEQIGMEQVPFGRILKECGIRHRTEVRHFLRIEPDAKVLVYEWKNGRGHVIQGKRQKQSTGVEGNTR